MELLLISVASTIKIINLLFFSKLDTAVIGGADTPTAIFLASQGGITSFLVLIGLTIGIGLIIFSPFLLFRKKN